MASTPKGVGDIQNLIAGITDLPAAEKIQLQINVIPKMSTTQRDALASPNVYPGLIIYNTTTNKLNVRTSSTWEAITSA